ncbi:MAG: alpha amylase C-terminal domain-containing protein, partial [Pseudomonadota bacterium]
NSDSEIYWGSGQGNLGGVSAEALPTHGYPYSLQVVLPPLSAVYLKREATTDQE